MRRRAKDVGTSRPLRRFERRAPPALDPRSLCSFGRHFLPVTEGWRLESESLKSLAVSLASRVDKNLQAILCVRTDAVSVI